MLPRSTTLSTLSRFGDTPHPLDALPKIPPAWSTGSKALLLMQSAVLSGSMRPVATVREVLRVESTGEAVGASDIGVVLRVFEEGFGGARGEVKALEGAVWELEGETWDREGAVEDLGTARK